MRVFGDGADVRVLVSASDLTTAAACEFALVRTLDAKLGRIALPPVAPDALLERAAREGDVHEARVLAAHRERADDAGGVVELPRPGYGVEEILAARDTTLELLAGGVAVLAQGTLFDGALVGHPDFLVLEDGAYVVEDAKLARSAKVAALLQIACYADMLARAAAPVAPVARLRLGSGEVTEHRLADLIPVYRDRRARLEAVVAERLADTRPAQWWDARYRACGRCDICTLEVAENRDVLLVAGMRTTQRARLHEAGIRTIEELAASTTPVKGIGPATLANLREQAALQVAQQARTAVGDLQPNGWPKVEYRVTADLPLRQLPAPSPGDVFFDFEGDPLWTADGTDWGLEYLFGACDQTGEFRCWWAHDRQQEKQALIGFLDWLTQRRARYPDLHVYHYAPYETTALKRLVGRHGAREDVLDDLLRRDVFVDLYATVRQSIRVSQPSYSIKYLEPLYMPDRRDDALDNAADSVAMYAEAAARREDGDAAGERALLDLIAQYNAYDVRSTLRLRNWLRSLIPPATPGVAATCAEPEPPRELSELRQRADDLAARLDTLAEGLPEGSDRAAVQLVSASLGYHAREDKPMWWEHFDRLTAPVEDWHDQRGVFVPDAVLGPDDHAPPAWAAPVGRRRVHRRRLRLVGALPDGTEITVGWAGHPVYAPPLPPGCELGAGDLRAVCGGRIEVLEIGIDDDGRDVLLVDETLPQRSSPHPLLPMAVVPNEYVNADSLVAALVEVGQAVAAAGSIDLADPGLDVLRRRPPTLHVTTGAIDSGDHPRITAAVRSSRDSYVAVQGPPGTGKTYAGAHVIRALVAAGWKVGVVAQSHAVVENLLQKAVDIGVPSDRIAKTPKPGVPPRPAPWLTGQGDVDRLLGETGGCLIGGTAWTMTGRLPRRCLDLLVIDEAGQFSLANTLAVSVSAPRLLLLGDPQQLPQVSQGTHPYPVDGSALGWLMHGQDTLPPELGFFLAQTRRMHPDLTRVVSRLSYADRLTSLDAVTATRRLDGVDPGLHPVPVDHDGNAVHSPQEIVQVVALVRDLLGRGWRESPTAPAAPLPQDGILVVAPYNAQVNALRKALDRRRGCPASASARSTSSRARKPPSSSSR